ncbi:hypothetical protein [Streptomyces sp. NPDC001743]|uniref:hypothetical protein n=1 Tax=Streptomyces sp. NPDC001743 TaxID=3154397 RepID=UPI00331E7036
MSLRDAPRSSIANGAQGVTSRSRARRAYGALVVGLVALSLGVSGCSGGDDDTSSASASVSASVSASTSASASPSAAASTSAPADASASPSATPSKKPVVRATVGSYAGWNLRKAVADARGHHVASVSYADASELGRSVVHTSNWKVCSQSPSAGTYSTATKVAFKILGVNESCANPPSSSPAGTSTSGGSSSSGGGDSGGGSGSGGSSATGGGGSTTTDLCSIRSNAGNCYHAGQFCRKADVGATTTDEAGRRITCSYQSSANRWHY